MNGGRGASAMLAKPRGSSDLPDPRRRTLHAATSTDGGRAGRTGQVAGQLAEQLLHQLRSVAGDVRAQLVCRRGQGLDQFVGRHHAVAVQVGRVRRGAGGRPARFGAAAGRRAAGPMRTAMGGFIAWNSLSDSEPSPSASPLDTMLDAMSVALGASDGRSGGRGRPWPWPVRRWSPPRRRPRRRRRTSRRRDRSGLSAGLLSSEANVSALKPWPDEDQPCIGGGGPFLPPDGRFCPTEANGSSTSSRRSSPGSRRTPSPAAAAAEAKRTRHWRWSSVSPLRKERRSLRRRPRRSSTRRTRCEKHALFQLVTTLIQ
jgi:hypothetical protein